MTRSSIKNGMNKKLIIIGSAALVIIIMVFWVFKVISPSVVGEWKIDYYITEDGKIKQDDIGAYYGEQFQIANSAFSVVFDSNGKVTLNLPTYKGTETVSKECEYEVEGNYIFLSGNGDRNRAFEIKGNTLIFLEDELFYRYNGKVAFKKK